MLLRDLVQDDLTRAHELANAGLGVREFNTLAEDAVAESLNAFLREVGLEGVTTGFTEDHSRAVRHVVADLSALLVSHVFNRCWGCVSFL
jgi:hypothetical protein